MFRLARELGRDLRGHRLREVLALIGFTRFEALTPDITGDHEQSDVKPAALALDPLWFPANGLCSNDPACAQRSPGGGMEGRWLHGAARHGCTLIAETSCEMRNDLLDRALVVPTLALSDAAFFPPVT